MRVNSSAPGKPLKVALIQANVDQNVKWDLRFTDSVFTLYREQTISVAADNPDLVVWSESAMPCYFLKRTRYRTGVKQLMDSLQIPLVFGGLDYRTVKTAGSRKREYFNSVFFYAPGQQGFQKYDKMRLVPFSERLPFEGLFPIISRVDLGEADFTAGETFNLFSFGDLSLFTPVCYEVVYPEQMRNFVNFGGDLMVHVTNDGWFGRSGMSYQHANITRFRALENGIPVARCANTGVSCFIDVFGRIQNATKIFTQANVVGSLSMPKRDTFYRRWGDWVGWGCVWLVLISGLLLPAKIILLRRHQ